MNTIFAAAVAMVWLVIPASSLQAYIVDWNRTGQTVNSQQVVAHTLGVTQAPRLFSNGYNWNRAVQFWQTVFMPATSTVAGISLKVWHTGANGTADLNIYEGTGVQGRLVSSTKLEWNAVFEGGWYGFKLDVPISLKGREYYTLALENLSPDRSLGLVINDNYPSLGFMQQGYYGTMLPGRRGYIQGTQSVSLNYILWY